MRQGFPRGANTGRIVINTEVWASVPFLVTWAKGALGFGGEEWKGTNGASRLSLDASAPALRLHCRRAPRPRRVLGGGGGTIRGDQTRAAGARVQPPVC